MRACTHGLIVSSSIEELEAWRWFAIEQGCQVLGLFESRRVEGVNQEIESEIDFNQVPIRGVFYNFERGDRRLAETTYERAIVGLAEWLSSHFF